MFREFILAIKSIPHRFMEARRNQNIQDIASDHLLDALKQNKRQGQRLAVFARWIALAVIAVMLPFLVQHWSVIFYEFMLLVFAVIGYFQLRAASVGQNRLELGLIILDIVLITMVFLVPNPFLGDGWPSAMQVRFENFVFYFVLLGAAMLAYSWRTVISFGVMCALFWLVGNGLLAFFGRDVETLGQAFFQASPDTRFAQFMDPNSVLFSLRVQEAVVIIIVAGILAANSWRMNDLLMRQISVERERENLSRYFAPAMVDQLAERDTPFGETRSQKVAVLFADIVGFTSMAENNDANEMVALLREFHKRLETAIFDNNGTLDKFLGDGVMATFGNPVNSPDDCANAISCATQMQETIAQWNREREASGKPLVKLSVGIHYGEVILGDIGSDRRLEFATLGDTVNVASRLEALTRPLGTSIVFSDALVEGLKAANQNTSEVLDGFEPVDEQEIRGRNQQITVWKQCSKK